MFLRGSRYEDARILDPPPSILAEMVRTRDIKPPPEIIEHTVRDGDRADLLAIEYFGDPRLWWRILDANPHIVYAGELTKLRGHIIVIPKGRD